MLQLQEKTESLLNCGMKRRLAGAACMEWQYVHESGSHVHVRFGWCCRGTGTTGLVACGQVEGDTSKLLGVHTEKHRPDNVWQNCREVYWGRGGAARAMAGLPAGRAGARAWIKPQAAKRPQ